MWVKFQPKNLNSGSCLPHPTDTYTCEVTTTSKVCGDNFIIY